MKKISSLLLFFAVLTACDRGERELTWKEDVLLQDGRIITLDRKARYEGTRELTQEHYGLSWYSVDFEHPSSKEKIHWESQISVSTDDLVRARSENQRILPSMILISVFVKAEDLYLILSPRASFDFYRCPDPPYILLKWEREQWKLVRLEDIPYRKFAANVLFDLNGGRDAIRANRYHIPVTVIANQTIGTDMPLVIDLTRMSRQTFKPENCERDRTWTNKEHLSN